ncbi:uncharacterized protein LOC106136751 [Amyelois transitella]|uniref:uncharacterized protein LOC106136751 n=1 Tax=Amyelois transitella TaxID=680683 RepID=UPI00298FA642|nr:uncharacterized protein LOC106136751 [Amyelois transitella]
MHLNEDEIEDLVGDVKYTDSQKSVTTSNVYSLDFTDSGSDKTDKHNSTGKETYVIDCDSDDSDKTVPLLNQKCSSTNVMPLIKQDAFVQYESSAKTTAASVNAFDFAQESFTQTSRTILELAALDRALKNGTSHHLETQTSFLSITENRTIECKIQLTETRTDFIDNIPKLCNAEITTPAYYNLLGNQLLNNSLDDGSSKFPMSHTESPNTVEKSVSSSNSEMLNIIQDDLSESFLSDDQNERNVFKCPPVPDSESDIDDDSLMEKSKQQEEEPDSFSDVTSLCNDVDDLYKKLSQTVDHSPNRMIDTKSQDQVRHFGLLTPLTEESTIKNSNIILDITPNNTIISDRTDKATKDSSLKSQESKTDDFKLPPINSNNSSLNSDNPHIKCTLSINPSISNKAAAVKCLYEGQDRWEVTSKEMGSGESIMLSGRSCDPMEEKEFIDSVRLPPIEGQVKSNLHHTSGMSVMTTTNEHAFTTSTASISIKKKIRELKMSNHDSSPNRLKSRSNSPRSLSPNEKLGDLADRGCDALCVELLRRLKSASWMKTAETLEEMPKVLQKYWGNISENRIADLIRQVSAHVESPRTQVSRAACNTLASLIKNTNYTKKPDFYEAVTTLLIKTGSFSRPVRTAANLALDEIVCDVDLTHCVTALCMHGAGHKSGLVRGAAARLLVVCCALASGGRDLLKARPPSAANARRLTLSSLATLLTDKNTDVRKYAERLYIMLRPLSNFEAYYLTDVDVDLATRQMKKYDQVLNVKQSR